MIITVSFSFEAESLEEGEAIVGTWKVSPGATLNGIQGTTIQVLTGQPVQIGTTGNVGTAIAVRKADANNLAPRSPAPVSGVPPAVPFTQPVPPPQPKEIE